MRRLALGLVLLAGCGGSSGGRTPSLSDARKDLAKSPPALAGLHAQANDVLTGDTSTVRARIAALHGHPVVVNKWASWCGPCRYEFPVLQRVSVKLGRRVAFIGLDSRDRTGDAKRFLRAHPLSYPSYFDPREETSRALGVSAGFPVTLFYDRRGRYATAKFGNFRNDAELESYIRRYADRG